MITVSGRDRHFYSNSDTEDIIEDIKPLLKQEFGNDKWQSGLWGWAVKEFKEQQKDREERGKEMIEEGQKLVEKGQELVKSSKRQDAKQEWKNKLGEKKKMESELEQAKAGNRSEKKIREDIIEKRKKNGQDVTDSQIQEAIDQQVEREIQRQRDPEEIEQELKKLEDEISDLETNFGFER